MQKDLSVWIFSNGERAVSPCACLCSTCIISGLHLEIRKSYDLVYWKWKYRVLELTYKAAHEDKIKYDKLKYLGCNAHVKNVFELNIIIYVQLLYEKACHHISVNKTPKHINTHQWCDSSWSMSKTMANTANIKGLLGLVLEGLQGE